MIWVNSATQTYSIYGSILCKLTVSNLWRVQVIFIYLFFCICNKLLSHNGWGQSYLRWQFLRFLWESSLIMWKKVHSIYKYIQKYFVLTASFTFAWKFQVSVRCLKGLALKINEKYMKRWHLWCGKFAEKTQIAWFCLNESKRSNSFQIKGEKVKRERESECLTTEFFLMWILLVRALKQRQQLLFIDLNEHFEFWRWKPFQWKSLLAWHI